MASNYNQHKNEYTQNYIRKKYKQLSIRLPLEGEITRDKIQKAAESAGISVNAYVLEAIREKMAKSNISK